MQSSLCSPCVSLSAGRSEAAVGSGGTTKCSQQRGASFSAWQAVVKQLDGKVDGLAGRLEEVKHG